MTARAPLPFPRQKPAPYIRLADEPAFDANRHLALDAPAKTISLAELGYDAGDIAACPSPAALTSAFRVFSDEGLAVMRDLCARMKSNRNAAAGTGANRLGSYIRGAGYRSQFIRDFCDCPQWLDFLSGIVGTPLARHSMPSVACGINYAPEDISRAVDTWHVDSVSFDVVILLNEPASFRGGEFQYFHGTKEEGEALLQGAGETGTLAELPAERVHTVDFRGAGYGFLQQGNKVFHRACRLLEAADRITVIPSFVPLSAGKADGTNIAALSRWSDPGIFTELARHEAWLARARLQSLIDDLPLEASAAEVANAIQNAVAGAGALAESLRQSRH